MRGSELSLLLLALVLCQAPRGPAAPVSTGAGGGTVLAKMYPRGSHWAVGHLMGKKSTDESPSLYAADRDGLKEQLRGYVRWEEAARDLLDLLEAAGNQSHQPPQHPPLSLQPTWDPEDGSYFNDVQTDGEVGRLSAPGSQGKGRNCQLKGQRQGRLPRSKTKPFKDCLLQTSTLLDHQQDFLCAIYLTILLIFQPQLNS
ncbi:gastrin-releasing peptide isoform X2 [Mus musculus]|uniref:gastrin-releasing peptide isoform X2 n=1 Tax=Mus musculus TaxID=10090 RepID=UPI0003D75A1C|nr:gastrin-releasing peptide isoform X2 [Mus musculus]|eukprot:XP_006525950.1 PREDICTED: gastrin-releasing peptide isoform X2 [Mus musculus]